jgi:uncharacterized protein (DUF58 family)
MERLEKLLALVRPVGWVVLGLGLGAAWLASFAGWRELAVLAAACLLLVVLAAPFLVGRTSVDVDLRLEPERIAAGESVAAGVVVRNTATGRLLPTTLEVPVGSSVHRYGIASLGPGGVHEESFTIRTERRGVIEVGPATTRRGDPVGVFSRDVVWTPVREVLVRPPMLGLESLGAGLLRDLEGVSTDAVSRSDLAFHALREYVPGDDLRHVHWRSSAKMMAAGAGSDLLVRQYLDTRRSHATLVVDDVLDAWESDEHFETGMSVAASIAVRALVDEFAVSFVCGETASSGTDGQLALDAVCRAGLGSTGIVPAARRAATVAPDTSLLFLVGGRNTSFGDLLAGAAAFPPEVRRFAITVEAGTTSRVTETAGLQVMHLADLADLPGLLRWSAR